ncbi:hypothetical protein ACOSP7_009206 [Xanthoceras sorbifolium]
MLEPKMILADTKFEFPYSLLLMRKVFEDTFIANAGYSRENVISVVIDEGRANPVAYSRLFVANPDLSRRFEFKAPLNTYNENTFYTHDHVIGYGDYPFLKTVP